MLFIFYILVAMTSYFANIQSIVFKESNTSFWRTNIDKSVNKSQGNRSEYTDKMNESYIIPQNLQNSGSSKIYDLKSNIFDRILSDEILTIQRNLYKNDMVHTLPSYITSSNNAPTPTLEIKQRWSVMNFMSEALNESNAECNNQNESNNKISTQSDMKACELCSHNLNNKVLGLRSLSDIKSKEATHVYHNNIKSCSCANVNAHRRYNHQSSAHKNNKEPEPLRSNTKELCSRSVKTSPVIETTAPSDIVHNTYFYTDTPIPFYYPLLITEDVPKKSKRRKTKRPYEHHLYYESNEEIYEEDTERNNHYDDGYIDDEKYKIIVGDYKNKHKPQKVEKVVINVQYEDSTLETNDLIDDVLNKGEIQVSNKNVFVNEIVDDLKKFYNDVIIKDCYCSSSIVNIVRSQFTLVLYIFILF